MISFILFILLLFPSLKTKVAEFNHSQFSIHLCELIGDWGYCNRWLNILMWVFSQSKLLQRSLFNERVLLQRWFWIATVVTSTKKYIWKRRLFTGRRKDAQLRILKFQDSVFLKSKQFYARYDRNVLLFLLLDKYNMIVTNPNHSSSFSSKSKINKNNISSH